MSLSLCDSHWREGISLTSAQLRPPPPRAALSSPKVGEVGGSSTLTLEINVVITHSGDPS